MDQTDDILEMGEKPELKGEILAEEVSAQEVNLTQRGAHTVRGLNVTLRQAGAGTVTAEQLTIRQGGAVKAEADHLEMTQGALVAAKTKTANLKASMAGLIVAEGSVQMDQAAAQILLSKGEVTMDQSGALVMISRSVKAEHSGATFIIARKVEGDIKTAFGPKESLIFGAAAGILTGLTLFLFRLLHRAR
jgi:hypothetical protein